MKCPCCQQELTAAVVDRMRLRITEMEADASFIVFPHVREFVSNLQFVVNMWDGLHQEQVPPMASEGV